MGPLSINFKGVLLTDYHTSTIKIFVVWVDWPSLIQKSLKLQCFHNMQSFGGFQLIEKCKTLSVETIYLLPIAADGIKKCGVGYEMVTEVNGNGS